MKPETAQLMIEVLQALTHETQDYALKLAAMEEVLQHHPEVQKEYQKCLHERRNDPSTAGIRQENAEILKALRSQLLRDRA